MYNLIFILAALPILFLISCLYKKWLMSNGNEFYFNQIKVFVTYRLKTPTAFVLGLDFSKNIFVSDALRVLLSLNELQAVALHETCHKQKKHGFFKVLLTLAILCEISYLFIAPELWIISTIIIILSFIIRIKLLRTFEYNADEYVVNRYLGSALASAIIKKKNPRWFSGHPSKWNRLKNIDRCLLIMNNGQKP